MSYLSYMSNTSYLSFLTRIRGKKSEIKMENLFRQAERQTEQQSDKATERQTDRQNTRQKLRESDRKKDRNIIIQWAPLNGITLGQRETDSNNRLILISE